MSQPIKITCGSASFHDKEEATKWYRMATEQGDATAQIALESLRIKKSSLEADELKENKISSRTKNSV